MAHISRHELKADQLRTTFEEFEEFAKQRYKEIFTVAGIIVAVVGLAAGLKMYLDRQEAAANADLGAALRTFGAYVGPAQQASFMPGLVTFPTAEEKYKKALAQFNEILQKYSRPPQPKAVAIARLHVGLCQAHLGQQDAAVKTLGEVARASDRNIASLAQFGLAGELLKAGKREEALRNYEELARRPSATVPESTARLALADAYRATDPAKARAIYQELEKKFASDVSLAQAIRDQMASLPAASAR